MLVKFVQSGKVLGLVLDLNLNSTVLGTSGSIPHFGLRPLAPVPLLAKADWRLLFPSLYTSLL